MRDANGKICSKKLMSYLFGIGAIVSAFYPDISDTVTITFAIMSGGNNMLLTNFLNKK